MSFREALLWIPAVSIFYLQSVEVSVDFWKLQCHYGNGDEPQHGRESKVNNKY